MKTDVFESGVYATALNKALVHDWGHIQILHFMVLRTSYAQNYSQFVSSFFAFPTILKFTIPVRIWITLSFLKLPRLEKILLQPDIRWVIFNLKTLHFWSTDSNYPRLLGRAFKQKKFTVRTAEKRESWKVLTKLPIHISSPTKRFNDPISKQASYSLMYVCRLDYPRSRERPPGRKETSCSVKNRIWTQMNLVDRGEMPNGASRLRESSKSMTVGN